MKRFIPLLFALAAFGAQADAQIVKKGNAYLFRMKFVKGSTIRYRADSLAGGMGANGQGMKISLPIVWKILNVVSGIAEVEATIGPVKMGTQVVMQASKATVKMNNLGKPVGGTGVGQQLTPVMPVNPIKVGTTWNAVLPMPGTAGAQQEIKATYKFLGIKVVDGKEVANISVSTTGQTKATGIILLLTSDASLYRSTLDMAISVDQQGVKSNYKVATKVIRV